jgi:hypothetical protein
MTKFVEPRPLADPQSAARRLIEIADTIEIADAIKPVQGGRMHVRG